MSKEIYDHIGSEYCGLQSTILTKLPFHYARQTVYITGNNGTDATALPLCLDR